MINRVTGEISFQNGLHIVPHGPVHSLAAQEKIPEDNS
jgi:hypothetical protein